MHSNPDDRRRLLHRVVSGGAVLLLVISPQAHAQGSFAELNGVRLYYEVHGSGPALVLVHGWAINSDYWDDQVPAFREAYRVIRYDRRGFGRSSGDPDVTADPVDLKALLTHLGEEKAFVVGHSAGSATSLAFAVHYPESTAGLILTGGGGVSDFAPGGLAGARAAQAERRRITRTYGIDSLFAQVAAGAGHSRDSLTAEQKARTGRMLAIYRATDLYRDLVPSGQTRRVVQADLPNVHVPTLLLIGERETPNVLERTEDMARRMPTARRIVLPGGGHLINLSQGEAYNEAVLRFLAEVRRDRRPGRSSGDQPATDTTGLSTGTLSSRASRIILMNAVVSSGSRLSPT